MPAQDFLVDRSDLHRTRVAPSSVADEALADGQVLLRVDRFGFTANNITYAAFGEAMGYWGFFPGPEGWGRVPVWGFADVEASAAQAVEPGDRVYGYLPMSTHVLVEPTRVGPNGFVDGVAHRSQLPGIYNQYVRTATDPSHRPEHENHQMLLRPLFMTSFVLDDFLADNEFFGADQVLVTSASSKTAIGLARVLAGRSSRPEIVGLTSATNHAFVEGLATYDRVVSYEQVRSVDAAAPATLVELSGASALVRQVHEHFGRGLRYSAIVGATHWDELEPGAEPLPGPQPELFFAPTQIEKRTAEWGPGEVAARVAAAWLPFVEWVDEWMTIEEHRGAEAVNAVYLEVLDGQTAPNRAQVLTLHA